MAEEAQKYQEMLSEVETLIKAMQNNDDDDLDQLVKRVERGYSLIKSMRSRLDHVQSRIEKLRCEYEENQD